MQKEYKFHYHKIETNEFVHVEFVIFCVNITSHYINRQSSDSSNSFIKFCSLFYDLLSKGNAHNMSTTLHYNAYLFAWHDSVTFNFETVQDAQLQIRDNVSIPAI